MRPKRDLPPGAGPQATGPQASGPQASRAGERPASRDLLQLRRLWAFVRPYRRQVLGATAAVAVAAGTVLGLGFGLRKLVDEGFASGNAALLRKCEEF